MASELADGTQVYSISPQKTGEYCTYIATALVHLNDCIATWSSSPVCYIFRVYENVLF